MRERTMRALLKRGTHVSVTSWPAPKPRDPHDVVVRVALAGVCRTDVYVARGLIAGALDPLVLGHELSGTVAQVGPNVTRVAPGDRVAVMPILPCRACPNCLSGDTLRCQDWTMLGIAHHGAFAQEIVVTERAVYPIPDAMTFAQAAYIEPVAASAAVLRANLPHGRGLIYGDNRIAQLTRRVLIAAGYDDLHVHDPTRRDPLPDHHFDFAVETIASTEAIATLVRAVRPGATIILKSRQHAPVAIHLPTLIRKELTLRAVQYAPFDDAIHLVSSGALPVDDLLGEVHRLEDFASVFEADEHGATKQFFDPSKV